MLLFAVPYAPWLQGLINPLTLALQGFMYKENELNQRTHTHQSDGDELSDNPKIVYLNLDGRESYINLRSVKLIKDSVYYISIFKEPDPEILEEHELQINMANSHLIVSEFSNTLKQLDFADNLQELPLDKSESENNSSKMLLFPLNSEYVKSRYGKKNPGKTTVP